jgi:hypothetical protein
MLALSSLTGNETNKSPHLGASRRFNSFTPLNYAPHRTGYPQATHKFDHDAEKTIFSASIYKRMSKNIDVLQSLKREVGP